MADSIQTKVLRVRSEESGGDRVAAALQKVAAGATAADQAVNKYAADAAAKVAPISEALAKAQDDFSKATLSTAKSIQNLERRIDPVARALNDYERAQKRVNLAIDSGQLSAEKGATILSGYETRYIKAAEASKKMEAGLHGVNGNAKLTQNQLLNLSRQGNDVITMFALGANPMQIFASQAGQLYDALAAEKGLIGGFKALGNSAKAGLAQVGAFALRLGPWGLAIGGATAAVAALAYEFRSKIPDMTKTLKDQEDILQKIEDRYDGIKEKIGALPKAATAGLNVAAGANIRDIRKNIDAETSALSTRFSNPGQNIFGFGSSPTSAYFAPIRKAVDDFRKSLVAGNPNVEAFRNQLGALYREAEKTGDVAMQKVIERAAEYTSKLATLEDALKAAKTAIEGMGKAEEELQAKQKHAADTYLTDIQRQIEESKLAIRHIQARTVAEKAMIAGEQERLKNSGKSITPDLDRLEQSAAEARVFAQAQRDADDALRDADKALGGAGFDGYAKSLKEINDQLREQIALNPENAATWERVAEAQKKALDIETRKSLFQGQQDTLAHLTAEAGAVSETDRRYQDLMTTVQAKIDLEKQGISVTNLAGEAYIENARKLDEYTAAVKKQKDAWDSVRSAEGSAIDDMIDGLTGGSSLKDALRNAEKDILKTFTTLGASNPLKNLLTGSNLPTLGDLFSGKIKAPSLTVPGFGSLGATPASAMWVRSADGISGSILGNFLKGYKPGDVTSVPLGAANDNLSLWGRAIKSVESSGNYGALGPLTKSGDRAYGAYQVMGANIEPWTRNAIGYAMTPAEFLAAPWAQDAVFNNRFGGYMEKYGNPVDAISSWFSGGPLSSRMGASDILGTTTPAYVGKVTSAFDRLADTTGATTKNLGTFGSGLGDLGSSIGNAVASAAGGSGGGGILGSIFSTIGSLFSFDGGGDTPAGPRVGGVDGRGGFLAVMHPQETVIDRTRSGLVRAPVSATPFARAPANENAPRPNMVHMTLNQHFGGAFSIDDVRTMSAQGAQTAIDTVKRNLPGWQHQVNVHGVIAS